MKYRKANSIKEVIETLDKVISESQHNNDPLGYFAVLYQKVTIKVKEEIANNYFDDGERMEKLDVVFANRYLEAYFNYKGNGVITHSWKKTFDEAQKYWPTVLQHLLLGINAHINLDLGIAAAQITKDDNIANLENDFNKINQILSDLVDIVQQDLVEVWPPLQFILKKLGRVDDFLINFSMKIARDGAWKFANKTANDIENLESLIKERDQKIAKNAQIISKPGFFLKLLLGIARIGERGSVSEKIRKLK